jgi:hypothetical protein
MNNLHFTEGKKTLNIFFFKWDGSKKTSFKGGGGIYMIVPNSECMAT